MPISSELVCGRGWLLKTCFVEPGRPLTLVIGSLVT